MSTIGHWLEQLERLGDWIARPLRWLVLLMVIATVEVVLLRYAFDTGAIFLQESVMYLYSRDNQIWELHSVLPASF